MRLIFKPYQDAVPEHVADRLAQVRDNFSNMTEEHVNSRHLNTYNRFYADITDLLQVDPNNDLGRKYWHEWNPETLTPDYTQPKSRRACPRGRTCRRRTWTTSSASRTSTSTSAGVGRRVRRRPGR